LSNQLHVFFIPQLREGVEHYILSSAGRGGDPAKQRQGKWRIACWIEHKGAAMMLGPYQDMHWDSVREQIEMELRVVGLWHLEDMYGTTIARAADLIEGRVYHIREMPDLTMEMLGHFRDTAKRFTMEQEMQKGMDIEAAERALPNREAFPMRKWYRELDEATKKPLEKEPEDQQQRRRRSYEIFVRGDSGTKICRARTVMLESRKQRIYRQN
jgi:hypothetical protein